jgi:ABC-2 type transport system ATP-binding protein
MSTKSEAIVVNSVQKTFDSVVAVNDVSFAVHQGEIFGLLGPNGAGKTTLIRLIMDIFRPDSGTIEVLGHHFDDEDKSRIGYLPEERGLYTRQKVLSVVEYFGMLKGLSERQARTNALRWLEKLDLAEVKDRKVQELSKGNQQKIQIAATVVAEPDILILDEPFSGLDPVNTRLIINAVRDLAAQGKTILLSTHQMTLVETLCQRVFMINRGRRVLYGDLDEIKAQYSDNSVLVQSNADYSRCRLIAQCTVENKAMKISLCDGVAPREFLAWLVNSGAEVQSFERAMTPLEDIFIKVVEAHE